MANVAFFTTDLLSRKGRARPATTVQERENRCSSRENLHWFPTVVAAPGLTPARRAANGQSARRKTTAGEPRIRASLRLRRDLHGQFKGYCTAAKRTQQSVLVQALDEYLVRHDKHTEYTSDAEHAGDRRCPVPV